MFAPQLTSGADKSRTIPAAGAGQKLVIQQKLEIGSVNDPLEYEADAVADKVMRMPETPFLQRQNAKDDDDVLQKKEATSVPEIPFVQCKGAACEEEDKKALRKKEMKGNVSGALKSEAPSIVHEVLSSAGQPLDTKTRTFMESRFRQDFSGVRVHNDAQAAESARSVNARAYTVGSQIAFGTGQYVPHTSVGRQLLAHELAHTMQQGGIAGCLQPQFEISPVSDPVERGPERMVAEAHFRASAQHSSAVTPRLQRRGFSLGGVFAGIGRSIVQFFTGHDKGYDEGTLQRYIETLDSGEPEGDFDSDDKARAIIHIWRRGDSRFVLTAQRKVLLIREMMAGFTGDDDEEAILELLERSYGGDLQIIFGVGGVNPVELNDNFHGAEWKLLQDYYARRFRGGMAAVLHGQIEPIEFPVPLGDSLYGREERGMHDFPSSWSVPCVMEILCSQDHRVVEQLQKLTVKEASEVIEIRWVYNGSSWIRETHGYAASSSRVRHEVVLKNSDSCPGAVERLIHETRHINQLEGMDTLSAERDAYTFAVDWAIRRGIPAHNRLRRINPHTGAEEVNTQAVEDKVHQEYSGIDAVPGAQMIGHDPLTNETIVLMPNKQEEKRTPLQGDSYQDVDATKAAYDGLRTLDPKEWVCPPTFTH
jgi:hypothetical protein